MTANDNRPDDHSSDRHTANEAQEKALSTEGRSLSAWALFGAVVFVVAMVVLAFSVWTGAAPVPRQRRGHEPAAPIPCRRQRKARTDYVIHFRCSAKRSASRSMNRRTFVGK